MEGWDHPQILAAVLAEEVAARETHGGQARVKAARFPQSMTTAQDSMPVDTPPSKAAGEGA